MKKKLIITLSIRAGLAIIAILLICAYFLRSEPENEITPVVVANSTYYEVPVFDDETDVRTETDSSGNVTYILDGIRYEIIEHRHIHPSFNTYTMSVTGFDGEARPEVVIPAFIGNMPVTEIADSAFSGQGAIETLTVNIPDYNSMRLVYCYSIYSSAFAGCSGLKKVVVAGESRLSLGEDCFAGCENLESVTFNTRYVCLGNSSFEGDSSLKEFVTAIHSVHLNNNVFSGCASITELDFSGGYFFDYGGGLNGCSSLKKLTIGGTSDNTDIDGTQDWFKINVLDCCPALETIVYCGTEDEWKNVIGDYNLGEIKVEYKPGD